MYIRLIHLLSLDQCLDNGRSRGVGVRYVLICIYASSPIVYGPLLERDKSSGDTICTETFLFSLPFFRPCISFFESGLIKRHSGTVPSCDNRVCIHRNAVVRRLNRLRCHPAARSFVWWKAQNRHAGSLV